MADDTDGQARTLVLVRFHARQPPDLDGLRALLGGTRHEAQRYVERVILDYVTDKHLARCRTCVGDGACDEPGKCAWRTVTDHQGLYRRRK